MPTSPHRPERRAQAWALSVAVVGAVLGPAVHGVPGLPSELSVLAALFLLGGIFLGILAFIRGKPLAAFFDSRSRRKAAGFPTGKTFDAWDPNASSIPLLLLMSDIPAALIGRDLGL